MIKVSRLTLQLKRIWFDESTASKTDRADSAWLTSVGVSIVYRSSDPPSPSPGSAIHRPGEEDSVQALRPSDIQFISVCSQRGTLPRAVNRIDS